MAQIIDRLRPDRRSPRCFLDGGRLSAGMLRVSRIAAWSIIIPGFLASLSAAQRFVVQDNKPQVVDEVLSRFGGRIVLLKDYDARAIDGLRLSRAFLLGIPLSDDLLKEEERKLRINVRAELRNRRIPYDEQREVIVGGIVTIQHWETDEFTGAKRPLPNTFLPFFAVRARLSGE